MLYVKESLLQCLFLRMSASLGVLCVSSCLSAQVMAQSYTEHCDRGAELADNGDFGGALGMYAQAIQLNPNLAEAFESFAWIRATCPNAQLRNGQQALAAAVKACQLTGNRDATCLSTLAAAYAEVGSFDRAVQLQTQALNVAPEGCKSVFRQMLKQFQSGRPFREGPVGQSDDEANTVPAAAPA